MYLIHGGLVSCLISHHFLSQIPQAEASPTAGTVVTAALGGPSAAAGVLATRLCGRELTYLMESATTITVCSKY